MEHVSKIIHGALLKKTCKECSAEFELENNEYAKWFSLCAPCRKKADDKLTAERAAQAQQDKKDYQDMVWRDNCPPIFRSTEIEKLPCQSAFREIMSWKYGPSGLVLHGPSGLGKSRCAWLLIEREHKFGKRFKAVDSMAGLRYASLFSSSSRDAEEWIEDLIATEILFMDDVFKNKLTDSFEGAIFTVIDQRIQQMKPTILTSNDTGKTLAARMTEDRAEPLVRRLREHCQTIIFRK